MIARPQSEIEKDFMITKTTEELQLGDKVRRNARTPRHMLIPLSENAGTVQTVGEITPWMLTSGPNAGQQARHGRRKNSPLLWTVGLEPNFGESVSATLSSIWVIAEVHNVCTSQNPEECKTPLHEHIDRNEDSEGFGKPLLCWGCDAPAHWDENAQDYFHDSPEAEDCFMIRKVANEQGHDSTGDSN